MNRLSFPNQWSDWRDSSTDRRGASARIFPSRRHAGSSLGERAAARKPAKPKSRPSIFSLSFPNRWSDWRDSSTARRRASARISLGRRHAGSSLGERAAAGKPARPKSRPSVFPLSFPNQGILRVFGAVLCHMNTFMNTFFHGHPRISGVTGQKRNGCAYIFCF